MTLSPLGRLLDGRGLDVLDDAATLAMYSSDASLYRVPPTAVVRPRSQDDVASTLEVCRAEGVPLTARGAGTSVAGNAIGPGIVLDFSRHLGGIVSLDPERRVAVVRPGTVQRTVQQAAAPHGLRFGPDPSTHARCTIGGMIGNDACGSHSLGYGRTADNVRGLTLLTAAGDVIRTGGDADVAGGDRLLPALRELMAGHLATARTEFGRFGRQVSGYAAHNLLPERFDLTRALVGSEGTLGVITEAEIDLVAVPAHRLLCVLGFTSMAAAGAAAATVVAEYAPTACEGIDSRILDVIAQRLGPAAVPALPAGRGWLLIEISGADAGDVLDRADRLARSGLGVSGEVVPQESRAAAIWRIREDGAGLAGRAPSGRPAWAGWEDAAVPPERLGSYLERFDELVAGYGLSAMPYGHFGDGCVHVRLDFPFEAPDGTRLFREFLLEAAKLVADHGGSLSGEHGDGRARSELLPLMYSAEALRLFAGIKHVFDPDNLLNPGVLVDPDPVAARIRIAQPMRTDLTLAFRYSRDGGELAAAVHRCTGVGKCRADNTGAGGIMCPSYQATHEEKDSTRGRARVLQDLVAGHRLDWRSPEVHHSLDLCLSCKGCSRDCPTGIDMATYKSEVLHQSYRRRIRPRSHYTLGWLPRWTRLAGRAPKLADRAARMLTASGAVGGALLRLAGVDPRRSLPSFAPRTFRSQWKRDTAAHPAGRPVLIFVDSFSDVFSPTAVRAVVDVLTAAGYSPEVTGPEVCCGLTWITTGQLDGARRILTRTIDRLAPDAARGVPIVGVEPSCTAVLRHDAVDLLGSDVARTVAAATRTLAELLEQTPDWQPPDLSHLSLIVQPHCHHRSVLDWAPDERLLRRTGATVRTLGGCCGLAGNFGMELGHYEVSLAVAGNQLLPALDAEPDAIFLADGFSCRTQAMDLRDRRGQTLAELLVATTAHSMV